MRDYLSCAETAKLVRQALKEAFPGVKFSVRSDTYSGGASIRVQWIDGPNGKMVKSIAETFSGAYFDGMTDFKGSTYAMMDGRTVRFGADFVSCDRRYSRPFLERHLAAMRRKWGAAAMEGVQIMDDSMGAYFDLPRSVTGDRCLDRDFADSLCKRNECLTARRSKTAGRVIYLGNDGYSDVGALRAEEA